MAVAARALPIGPLGAGLRGAAIGGGAVTADGMEAIDAAAGRNAGGACGALATGAGSGAEAAGRGPALEPLDAMGAALAREGLLPQLRERAYCRIASFTR